MELGGHQLRLQLAHLLFRFLVGIITLLLFSPTSARIGGVLESSCGLRYATDLPLDTPKSSEEGVMLLLTSILKFVLMG